MSKPADGKYYIISKETTSDGTSLAITYNGENAVLTVTELGSQPTQVWVLKTFNSETQSISPEDTDSLQVDFGSGDGLLALPANDYVWAVRGSDDVYTIQDSAYEKFWFLDAAEVGQHVYGGTAGDTVLREWQLIAA